MDTMASTNKIAEFVAQTIRTMINDRNWQVGQMLPSQRDLAEALGVSRPSLREGISMLEAAGLLSSHPGKGVFIAADPHQVSTVTTIRGVEKAMHLHDFYQLRFALEPFIAGLAAQSATVEDLLRLELNVMQMQAALSALDLVKAAELDAEFHRLLVGCTTNPAFSSVVTQAMEAISGASSLYQAQRTDYMEPLREHELIMRCLKARDSADALLSMQRHINNAAKRKGIDFPKP